MAIYAVGDVQGCYDSLRKLLDEIRFDSANDELWFCGDLVNRGPKSAETLRFIMQLPRTCIVLGNHDLHLLAVSLGFRKPKPADTFQDVLHSDDREEILAWLRRRSLALYSVQQRVMLVHAGLHPSWSLKQGLARAREVEQLLTDDDQWIELLRRMYGDTSVADQEDPFERARGTINAFTRMRYCFRDGTLDFKHFGAPGSQPEDLSPWFCLRNDDDFRIVFGHWSMLGFHTHQKTIGLDSGCVHGGQLTAFRIDAETDQHTQVKCID